MEIFIRTRVPSIVNNDHLKIIDWSNASDRRWLQSHMHWAMHNQREVQIQPANDYHRTLLRIFGEERPESN